MLFTKYAIKRKKDRKKHKKTRLSYLLFIVSPGTGTVDGRLGLYDSGAIDVVVQSRPFVAGAGQEQPQLSPSNEGQVHDVIDRPFYMGKNLLQISVRGQTQVSTFIYIRAEWRVQKCSPQVHNLIWSHMDESCSISNHVQEV